MKRTHILTGLFACAGMLILILDGQTAIKGAQIGIDLCIKTVIPSLFPFFLLSILLTGTFSSGSYPLLKPLEKIFQTPSGAGAILIPGFLGGYPAGAQCTASAYSSGQLKKEDAERMLSFCNNAGPAFLFGMVSSMFDESSSAFLLWGIHIVSAILVAILLPSSSSVSANISKNKHPSISEVMNSAIRVMAIVCGWVILFRVVIAFLERWFLWMLPITMQVIVTGLLELSNGCCELYRISDPDIRFVVCSCLLASGGLCVTMQTRSAAAVLSIKPYLKGKLLQTLFSLLISVSVILELWFPVVTILLLLAMLLQKVQKRGRNPAALGV